MRKTIFVSTAEGFYMLSVMKNVDRCFRNIYHSVSHVKLSPEQYKSLIVSWEEFLDEHMDFLSELSTKYATDYIVKTREKKAEICLKDLRETGKMEVLSLRSFLGNKLFKATTSTEMCFKMVHEYAQTGDMTIDAMLDLTECFRARRDYIEGYLQALIGINTKLTKFRSLSIRG